MSTPPPRSAAVEALLAATPAPVGPGQAVPGPSPGPLAAVAAAARAFHPTFEPQNPARQSARAQAAQLRSYLQQVVTAIETACAAVPPLLDRASGDDLLAREFAREEIDPELVRQFLANGQALLDSVTHSAAARQAENSAS